MGIIRKILMIAIITFWVIVGTAQVSHSIIGAASNSPTQRPLPLNKYTGVAYLEPAECTGSLLKGGIYILTAAHCLSEDDPIADSGIEDFTATFKLPRGAITIPISNYVIHPGWTGYESEVGNDLAILKLKNPAPRQVEQYELYRNSNEIGKIFTKVGYGYIGVGAQDEESNSEGSRYAGKNRYEALIDILKDSELTDFSELVLGSQLLFDFDDGTAIHDTFGKHFPNLANKGLGKDEIATGNGDSGGPSFINGKIAGVSSWGYSDRGFFDKNIGDIDQVDDNGSFGEISGDVRVSFYANWIDSVTKGSLDNSRENRNQRGSIREKRE